MHKSGYFTGKGDGGDTGRLRGEARLSKSSVPIEAVGAVDEATSAIGLARAGCQSPRIKDAMLTVQEHLYRLLSHLSATPEARALYPGPSADDLTWLERVIVEIEGGLPQLTSLVLPGTSPSGAAFHVARTVVRRAERRVVALAEIEQGLSPLSLTYLNRLSSLLFVAAVDEDRRSGQEPNFVHGGTSWHTPSSC